MTTTTGRLGLDDVIAAREVLSGVMLSTPLLQSRVLSERIGGPVYLKCENLQRTGSFKARGAYLRIARLSEAERDRGVIAASAGNHAQGVAFSATLLGTKATVVMPEGAPLPKIAATTSYGADVILHGSTVEHALARAKGLAAEHGSVFIHPFEHPDVVAGQGTVGLEIVEQCPDVRTIAVPVGGGGLAAGIAVAAKGTDPAIRMIGVQADAVAPYPASLAAGHPVAVASATTMADGIAVAVPGELAFALMTEHAVRVVTVSEESLSQALLLCLERAKQVVEPAGAAAVASLLEHPRAFEPPVVAVLSGGNIDPLLLAKVLRHGLAAAGRYLTFRCRLPDRPGALATLLAEVAGLGANVLDVMHERVTPGLRVDDVEVLLQVETRGPGHCDSVIGQLRESGYKLLFS
ncbi:MAG TPA: threonine ammonia-lyase [Streptosporangiaceae bacterium]|jgi:threonine dehydratase|nr:threonine ammonia-lyase [Streptosporangiaceae bacterium]